MLVPRLYLSLTSRPRQQQQLQQQRQQPPPRQRSGLTAPATTAPTASAATVDTKRRWKTGWQRLAATNNAIVPRKRTPSDIRDQIIDRSLRADSSFSALVTTSWGPPLPRVSTTALLLLLPPSPCSCCCCCCSRGPRAETLTLASTRPLVVSVESYVDAAFQGRARPSTHLETVCTTAPNPLLYIPCLSCSCLSAALLSSSNMGVLLNKQGCSGVCAWISHYHPAETYLSLENSAAGRR